MVVILYLRNIVIGAVASIGFVGSAVFAQQMIPMITTGCPTDTENAGQGYCRAKKGTYQGQYMPAGKYGGCPSGTQPMGQGYCKTKKGF